jgi:potassium/hydrogen antiporter
VVITTLVQAPTLPLTARKLRVAEDDPSGLHIESRRIDGFATDQVVLEIPWSSGLIGLSFLDMRLPAGTSLARINRAGREILPGDQTLLRPWDRLLLLAPSRSRTDVEERIRAVHLNGRMASWTNESSRAVHRPLS